jgi:hypothetical protein
MGSSHDAVMIVRFTPESVEEFDLKDPGLAALLIQVSNLLINKAIEEEAQKDLLYRSS